jgi:hypothetical protein
LGKAEQKKCWANEQCLAEKRNKKSRVLRVPHQPVEAIRDEPVFLSAFIRTWMCGAWPWWRRKRHPDEEDKKQNKKPVFFDPVHSISLYFQPVIIIYTLITISNDS